MTRKLPHTFVLLFALTVVAAAVTWIVPAGEYARRDEAGRRLVDPLSFHYVEPHPAAAGEVLLAWPRGLEATAAIVFYLFLIGGAFGVIQATGALEAGIGSLVDRVGGRGEVVIPLLVVLFSLAGGTIGLAEEALAILPALVILVRRLGYDDLLAGAIGLAGAAAGFSGAFLNPFTIGVGQAITGLPLFSGIGFRLVVWLVVTVVTTIWISRAARRLKLPAPAASPASAAAADEHEPLRSADEAAPAVATLAAPPPAEATIAGLTLRRRIVLLALLAAIVLLVLGALFWSWGLVELSALFIATAIVAGLAGGLGADGTAESFVTGAAGFAGAALVVGLARGVLVIFDGARITDTLLHSLVGLVQGLPASLTVVGIYAVQVLLSYVVPSGSGQAALALPILAPLGDLVGVTRQTSVLAYQFGDGFSNVFTPTQGYFMAGLAMLRVPWTRWVKFLWPLQLLWLGTGLVFLLVAHAIRWGPF
ncbi:MAG TPA: C4-dicarboxylate ABC transporter permease [Thermoanaerobaculia bacterium]|jgi:uncharacterized ion transporter superfamily protein YfcC|nr:C4-dicarboxylate ABC transporter permease [Thermoanaerobaculia bacterium]